MLQHEWRNIPFASIFFRRSESYQNLDLLLALSPQAISSSFLVWLGIFLGSYLCCIGEEELRETGSYCEDLCQYGTGLYLLLLKIPDTLNSSGTLVSCLLLTFPKYFSSEKIRVCSSSAVIHCYYTGVSLVWGQLVSLCLWPGIFTSFVVFFFLFLNSFSPLSYLLQVRQRGQLGLEFQGSEKNPEKVFSSGKQALVIQKTLGVFHKDSFFPMPERHKGIFKFFKMTM